MNKNKEVDDFLAGLNEEGRNPFESEEDPFAEKPKVEDENESDAEIDETTEDAKPQPFHQDPKVQKYVQKQIDKALSDFRPKVQETEVQRFAQSTGKDEDEIADVLTRIIGNDTPEKVTAIKDFRRVLNGLEEKGAQRALKEFESRQQATVEAEKKAQSALTQGFEDIEEEFNVDLTSNAPLAKKNRNEFIDFVKRIAPKDANGQVTEFPDFSEAYTVFQETRKTEPNKTTIRAKELSNRSMGRSSGDTTQTQQSTDKSWNAVDKLFNKLLG